MLIPCPECHISNIDNERNKRRLCKTCADKENKAAKRARQPLPPITFEQGCKKALHDNSNGSVHASALIKCRPARFRLIKYDNRKTDGTTHLLIHNSELQQLAEDLELTPGEPSKTMELELDFPAESTANLNHCKTCDDPKNTIEIQDIRDAVSNSNVPKLLRNIGPYVEVDNEVLDLLNTDFRIHPNMLPLVPKLFTGALIYGDSILLAITTEVYSRHASIDLHLETVADSIPSSTSYYKNRLLCTILTTADGRGLIKKLIIGSKTVNLLVTCSADILQNDTIHIGPQVNINSDIFTKKSTRLFLRSEEVDAFKTAFEQASQHRFQSVSCIRQLSSSFDHISTYKPYRATLDDFDDVRFMPSTVFTLCDTPNNGGYGSNNKSCAKIGSLLLQKVAIALNMKRNLDKEILDPVFTIYESANKAEEADSWKVLGSIVNDIKERYETNDNQGIDVIELITHVNFSKLASSVGGSLSKANEKIGKDVKDRLLRLNK